MAEQVDAADLKSADRKVVSVRFGLCPPLKISNLRSNYANTERIQSI